MPSEIDPAEPGPLQWATNAELVAELDNRTEALIISYIPLGGINCYRLYNKGKPTDIIGLASVLKRHCWRVVDNLPDLDPEDQT